MNEALILAVLIFVAATLYAAVGQAGGSGYIALMALLGLAPETIRSTALVLNILVASVTTLRYWRAGTFSPSTLAPFLIGSLPFALIGGAIHLPGSVYRPFVGVVLLLAAAQMVRSAWRPRLPATDEVTGIPRGPAVAAGGLIGLLAGLSGTGGGLFLTPVLLWTRWASMHEAIRLSSGFILFNSIAALLGNLSSVRALPAALPLWALASLAGGLLGSELGSRWFSPTNLRLLLGAMLTLAALRLLFAG